MKKLLLLFLFLGIFGFFSPKAEASHVAGVDISYQCLGNDSFLITVNIFRDCSGVGWSAPSINISLTSTCGQTINATLNTTNTTGPNGQPVGINISQLCPNSINQSACNGGSLPGMQLYTYQGIVVITPPCNTWTIGYSPPCCRNNTNILNLTNASSGTFAFATLNSQNDSCNSSPSFSTNFPNPYACVNQQVCYDYGVTEQDGDSLVYSLVSAYTALNTQAIYNAGYTPTVPIPGITIDPQTGKVVFTPTTAGNYVVVVQVCEYDRATGLLLGCIMRDMQFVVDVCLNQAPSLCTSDTIANFSGNGAKINNNTVEVCYGQNFSFDIVVTDPDPADSLTATSNISSVLPGATMTLNHAPGGNPLTITFSWTATIGSNPFNSFNLQVSDQNCPITATNTAVFNVKVVPSTYGGPDQQICKGVETATLSAIGGSQFTWSVISGDINSLSCTNCKTTIASPNTTTAYQVTSNLSSSCKNTDTVIVTASTNFSLNMSNDTLICFNDSTIQIGTFPTINRLFHYEWSPSSKLDFDTLQQPNATPITNTTYNVTVTSDSGCVKTGNVTVNTTLPFPTSIEATTLTGDSVSCQGVPITLNAKLGVEPTSCGISSNPCSGLTINQTAGNGTNTNLPNGGVTTNAWPAPYGNSNRSARHQFIIRKSELAAAGINAGTISSLAFDIASIGSAAATYNDFSIMLGCISDSSFTFNPQTGSFWKVGLTQVFTPKNVNIALGWNVHQFDFNYDYDGNSHLIVEVCFNNPGATSQNAQTRYTNTTFGSSLYLFSNSFIACNNSTLIGPPVNRRPNMRFGFCGGPNPAGYTYQWWPITGLSNPTINQPTATLQDSITYNLAVTDTAGKCFDTSSVKLYLTTLEKSNDTAVCPGVQFQLFAQGNTSCVGGAIYQWTPANLVSNANAANPIASITQTTLFTVTFQDQCGCTITDSILVTKKEIDSLDVNLSVPTCGLQNGGIIIRAFGGDAPYQFSIDSGQTFTADSVFGSLDNGIFDLLVLDNSGCYSSRTDTLQNTAPIVDSIKTKDLTCFESSDGVVEVFTTGGNYPLTYSVDGGNTYVSTDSITGLTAGLKNIIVKAVDGCETFPRQRVLTQPNLLEFDLNESVVSCYDSLDGQLTVTPFGGTKPYSYSWSTPNGSDSTASNLGIGNYTVTLTDAHNCQADSTYFVDQPSKLILDSINFVPITCHGYGNGILSLFTSGGNTGYTYSLDTGNTFYTQNVFDSIGPFQYYIRIQDIKNCTYDTIIPITEPAPLVINPQFDSTTICVSNCLDVAAPFTGGNQGKVTYFWTPSFTDTSFFNFCPTEDQKFIVYAKDVKNCVSNIEEMHVFLYDSLNVDVTLDTHICETFGIPIEAFPSGGDGNGFNYEWNPYPGLNNPKIKAPFANPSQTTTYKVILTDNCGSPAVEDSIKIEVFPNPQVAFSSDETEGCEQQLIYYFNDTDIGFDCLWDFGDGTQAQSCNLIAHPYNKPGYYDVSLRVIAPGGCSDSLLRRDYIKIFPNPVADFVMNPQPASVLGPEVTFTDISDGKVNQWQWNFGSFATSEEQNPVIEFPVADSGTFPVRLAVTTSDGCKDDTIKYALVDVNLMIYAPKGFTPNGDGLNDYFFPQGTGLDGQEFELFIFDRWGNVVFRTNTLGDAWDGVLPSGKPAPVGVYVWKLEVGDYTSNRRRHEVIGNLSLMR